MSARSKRAEVSSSGSPARRSPSGEPSGPPRRGAGIRGSADTPLPEIGLLRKEFAEGRLRVLGEVSAQYAGLTLSDPKYEPYLALAEELDIPVALHTGIGPPGISYDPCCRGFRASLGSPALVEDALLLTADGSLLEWPGQLRRQDAQR